MSTQPQKPENQDTVTMAEAIEITGFSRQTIYDRINSGELVPLPKPRGYKKNPLVKFLRADVEKLLNS